jgi:mono/diheme cytochrome c family protein
VPATKPKIPLLGALALAVVLAAALPARAQDARRGRQLYETLCLTCHYEHVHERAPERSQVHDLEQLRREVTQRSKLTGVRFTREDIDDVVAYLDQSHYHFAK